MGEGRRKEEWGSGQKTGRRKGGRGEGIDGGRKGRREGESFAIFKDM